MFRQRMLDRGSPSSAAAPGKRKGRGVDQPVAESPSRFRSYFRFKTTQREERLQIPDLPLQTTVRLLAPGRRDNPLSIKTMREPIC